MESSTSISPQSTPSSSFSYQVGSYSILLESGIRSELLTRSDIYPLPFAPRWCLGLVGVRGDLFPVIDMHYVLAGEPPTEGQQLLWLQPDNFAAAVISCDGLPKQITPPDVANANEQPEHLPGWVQQVWTIDEQQLLLAADHVRLFQLISYSRKS